MKVALLLHMHQPLYTFPRPQAKPLALLPWTFLHGIGEYYDVARTLLDTPAGRVTVNFSPVLLDQWDDYLQHRIEDVFLRHFLKPAEALTPAEQEFLLQNFFAAHPLTQIGRFPRYQELYERRERPDTWTVQDFRDLQVLFVLSYTGERARRDHPGLETLTRKAKGFTENDKQVLYHAALEILGRVPEMYRALAQKGHIEVSLSPYFHPILPLLIDAGVHTEAGGTGPPVPGIAWPEDARLHLEAARARGREVFGSHPFGLWPSEGSVSEAALRLIQDTGFRWAATDQQILAKTRPGATPYRLYAYQNLPLVFRDTELSDRIGFVYSTWTPEEAAADLVARIRSRRAPDARFVALILDGENPWVAYRHGGMAFLRHLLTAVDRSPDLEWATVGDLAAQEPAEPLDHLAPGSWIHGTFDTWMGHPEKRRAWEVLRDARQQLKPRLPEGFPRPASTDPQQQALYAFFAAEGSDWFWWLGEDHPTPLAPVFDRLFRALLSSAFELLAMPVPPYLSRPIKASPTPQVQKPRSLLQPYLDGQVTHYLEWKNAGRVFFHLHPAMAGELLQAVYYGFDHRFLFLRLDFSLPCSRVLHRGRVRVQFRLPQGRVEVDPQDLDPRQWGCKEVLELAVPWPGTRQVEMAVTLELDGRTHRYPAQGWVRLDLTVDWMV